MALNGLDVCCSAVLFRTDAALLVRRNHDGTAVWTLPGGTPREGERTATRARHELSEGTRVSADRSRVAFVREAMAPGGCRRRPDIVFLGTGLAYGAMTQSREPGAEPHFIPVDQLNELPLMPPLAGHLRGLLHQGVSRYAPYLGNLWRTAAGPEDSPRHRSPGSAELLTRAAARGHFGPPSSAVMS